MSSSWIEAARRAALARMLAHLVDGVACGDVADLMAQHGGELGLGLEVGEDAARHVDPAPRQRERVDAGVVENLEAPGQVGALAGLGEAAAHLGDVGRELLVAEHRARGLDLLGDVAPHRQLGLLAEEAELGTAGGGVGGAAGGGERRQQQQEQGAGGLGARHGGPPGRPPA